MQNINLDDFLTEGIIKEKDFREKVSLIDWKKYQDQKVIKIDILHYLITCIALFIFSTRKSTSLAVL